ncbi:hypothetical protein ACFYKX_07545 [Cytobacillus sp. FJAT-54145]|uniref:DUF3888 domain-containing protein n=1 Tax=Cytobacillus spartinae TaxID=3299023 RepID=A0ABW6KA48_9BACI
MRRVLVSFIFVFLFSHLWGFSALGEQPDKKLMEEIIVQGLHGEISKAIKEKYNMKVAQYDGVEIVSITKEAQYEPSEEMKPGMTYEIVIKLSALINEDKRSLEITFVNGENGFVATKVKPY